MSKKGKRKRKGVPFDGKVATITPMRVISGPNKDKYSVGIKQTPGAHAALDKVTNNSPEKAHGLSKTEAEKLRYAINAEYRKNPDTY